MSLEAARDLSVQDLLHVLNEKLNLEYTNPPPVVLTTSLGTDVSIS